MLPNQQINSDFADANQLQQNDSILSSEDLLRKEIKSLKKNIRSLKIENRVGLGALGLAGTIIAVNWSTIGIVAAAPAIGIGVASVAAIGIALFCAFKIYEHRAKTKESAEKGFKIVKSGIEWSAEKTVEGAKYSAGKIKAGAEYSAGKIKDGYEYSTDSLKKGAKVIGSITPYDHATQNVFLARISTEFTQDDNDKVHL